MTDAKRKSVPVLLSTEAYEGAKAYGSTFDIALTKVVSRAVIEWLETVGAARIESLQTTALAGKKVLQFKVPDAPAPDVQVAVPAPADPAEN